MGYVYVIGPAEPLKPYRVKIGKANDPQARLDDLQCGSPVLLEVLWAVETGEPFKLEGKLHRELADYRKHGEWFELGPNPVAMVEQVAGHYQRADFHNGRKRKNAVIVEAPAQGRILAVLAGAGGPLRLPQIYAKCPSLSPATVRVLLSKMQRKGLVRSPGYGTWEYKQAPRSAA